MTGDLTYKFGAGGVGFGAKGEVGFYSTVVNDEVKYGVYISVGYDANVIKIITDANDSRPPSTWTTAELATKFSQTVSTLMRAGFFASAGLQYGDFGGSGGEYSVVVNGVGVENTFNLNDDGYGASVVLQTPGLLPIQVGGTLSYTIPIELYSHALSGEQRVHFAIGSVSSARMPGEFGTVPAGDEMNALDVISEYNSRLLPKCFSAGTEILMSDGARRPIEALKPGDLVLSFKSSLDGEFAELVARPVVRTFQNITQEWLILRNADEEKITWAGTTVTPGHYFLTPNGKFARIDDIIERDPRIVSADGCVIAVKAERIKYSEETAHLYEQGERLTAISQGSLALAPQIERGWITYNFEVADLHTYVANGIRVHNDSVATLAFAASDFYDQFGFDFDGTNSAHLDLMMGAIVDGKVTAYGDYVGALSDDRFFGPFYDAVKDKIVVSFGETETIVTKIENGQRETVTRFRAGTEIAVGSEEFYDEEGFFDFGFFYDDEGDFESIQTADGASTFASGLGNLFGSLLGKAIGNGNHLAEVAATSLIGFALDNLKRAIAANVTGNVTEAGASGLSGVSESMQYGVRQSGQQNNEYNMGADVLGRLVGIGSSLLIGELADALGLDGFEGQVFQAVTGGISNAFISEAVKQVSTTGSLELANVFAAVDMTKVVNGISASLGGIFGSALASLVVTPDSPEAAVFASVGSAVGSIAGTAIGIAMSAIPFIGPFIGAFLGQVIATWAGNALSDNDELAGLTIGYDQATGRLGITDARILDHGNILIADSLAKAVMGTANQILDFTGSRLDKNGDLAVEVGYYNNSRDWLYAFAGTDQEFYRSAAGTDDSALARIAQKGIDQVIRGMDLVAGDVVMRRAFNAASSKLDGSGDLTMFGFDLQVAKDYRYYLDNTRLVNELILADSGSNFAITWLITLQRAEELGLNRASTDDFKSGIYANLEGLGVVDKLDWAPDFSGDTLVLRKLNHVIEFDNIFGPGLTLNLTGGEGNETPNFSGYQLHSVLRYDGAGGDDVITGHQGTDLLVGDAGNDYLDGGAGHDWLHGGDGDDTLIGGLGDDLLVGGAGNDLLIDGSGVNTFLGGDGNDTIEVNELGRSNTVVAATSGSYYQYDVVNLVGSIDPAGNIYARRGTDLMITLRSGSLYTYLENVLVGGDDEGRPVYELQERTAFQETDRGELVVKDFFLTRQALDNFHYIKTGTDISGADLWRQLLPAGPVSESVAREGGGHRQITLDGAESESWASITTDFDAQGRVAQQVVYDDLSNATTVYGDADNIIYADGTVNTIDGLGGHDRIHGSLFADILRGGIGNDVITGDAANDSLFGDSGDDYLDGGAGDDQLFGGAGTDALRGSAGADSVYGDDGNDSINGDGDNDTLSGGSGDDLIHGDDGDDTLDGDAGNDKLFGGAGNDTLRGGTGLDELYGGVGNDVLSGGNDADTLWGEAGDDILQGEGGNDTLRGGAGADWLSGGSSNDVLNGDDGNDTLDGDEGNDKLYGGVGADILRGGSEADELYGEADADQLQGGSGEDGLSGGDGNDTLDGDDDNDKLWGGAGEDILRGGSGADELSGEADADQLQGGSGDDVLNGDDGNDTLDGDDGYDKLSGGAGDDTLRGGAQADELYGEAGDDRLEGGDGPDKMFGGLGTDTLIGGEGDDELDGGEGDDELDGGEGLNTLRGGSGNDSLTSGSWTDILSGDDGDDQLRAGAGNDVLSGGTGHDKLYGEDGDDQLHGDDGDDELFGDGSADKLYGGAGNDKLYGDVGDDQLEGGAGDDLLQGGDGDDVVIGGDGVDGLEGGNGNDTLSGGALNDTLYGNAGNDTLRGEDGNDELYGETGADELSGGAGADMLSGGSEGDKLYGDDGDDIIDGGAGKDEAWGGLGADTLTGGTGDDTLDGGDGDDILQGGNGDDILLGGAGDDTIDGGPGNDTLDGGSGDDILIGGADTDVMTGGEGSDTAVMSGQRIDYEITLYNAPVPVFTIVDKRPGSPNGTDFAQLEYFRFGGLSGTSMLASEIADSIRFDRSLTLEVNGADGLWTTLNWSLDQANGWETRVERFEDELRTKLMSRTKVNDSGGKTTEFWDTNGSRSWSYYTASYSAAGLTQKTYIYDDGTKTIEYSDASNSNTWKSYIDTYDALARRTSQAGTNDAGDTWLTSWDPGNNTAAWSTVTTYKDAEGRRTSQNGTYDDGRTWASTWDATNAQNWDEITNNYDAVGRLVSQFGIYDNNARWAYSWDVLGQYSWSRVFYHYDAQNRQTYQANDYDDGTHGYYTWDQAGSYNWWQVLDVTDVYGRQTRQHITYDDSRVSDTYWDVNNAYNWSRYTDWYDALGRRTSQNLSYDDGTSTNLTWDQAGSYDWWQATDMYDAYGRMFQQSRAFDDGRSYNRYWDVNNAGDWSYYTNSFDAWGRHTNQDWAYDDGRTVNYAWDQSGAYTWWQLYYNYDAYGRMTYHDIRWDDGQLETQSWDQFNTESWWHLRYIYDPQARLTYHEIRWDDGRFERQSWDVTNSQGWSWLQYVDDAAGRLYYHSILWDDGRREYQNWDVNNTSDWASWQDMHDGAGRHTARTIDFDNGNHQRNYYDPANAEGWSSIIENYDGAWRLSSKNVYYDDGSRTEESWDPANVTWWDYTYWHYNAWGFLDFAWSRWDDGSIHYAVAPLAFDLNGDGLDLAGFGISSAAFDWNGDGVVQQTAWVGPQDGFLAIDLAADGSAGGDGVIDQRAELAFTDWSVGAKSDLVGLRLAFDSNSDGVLDASDIRWDEFRIWQDADQDGMTDAGELKTLVEWGVSSISLSADAGEEGPRADGSSIVGAATFNRVDGSTGIVSDVSLTIEVPEMNGTGSNDILLGGTSANRIEGKEGDDELTGGEGDDVFAFAANFERDIITDFVAGSGTDDVTEFDDAVFADLSAVLAAASQVGADTLITYDANNTVTLKNVAVASLHQDDFRFV